MFDVFKDIRERLESFRVKILHFCYNHLRRREKLCKKKLYSETKIPIRLNIFDFRDLCGSLLVLFAGRLKLHKL